MSRPFTCAECGVKFYRPSYNSGPDPTYCGATCRKRASRRRARQTTRRCPHGRTRPDVVNGYGRRCVDCGERVAS